MTSHILGHSVYLMRRLKRVNAALIAAFSFNGNGLVGGCAAILAEGCHSEIFEMEIYENWNICNEFLAQLKLSEPIEMKCTEKVPVLLLSECDNLVMPHQRLLNALSTSQYVTGIALCT